ncbi:hypothetical protein EYB53_021915 [Candidatus Chloroploca sp. M-50]|uniref:Uncharacterized protein n=1 Tax=Candidatus Chloroploca mongolica TaxID=2528176 RepID=A0ABS4DG12_9CHLR|nr:hypothetical protein [Candidatus Chloroploca mongolica]MBP1468384.1 hypothetical protein [Candidatus Chloroploca mongolica]
MMLRTMLLALLLSLSLLVGCGSDQTHALEAQAQPQAGLEAVFAPQNHAGLAGRAEVQPVTLVGVANAVPQSLHGSTEPVKEP